MDEAHLKRTKSFSHYLNQIVKVLNHLYKYNPNYLSIKFFKVFREFLLLLKNFKDFLIN